jgi:hypothetical protein
MADLSIIYNAFGELDWAIEKISTAISKISII